MSCTGGALVAIAMLNFADLCGCIIVAVRRGVSTSRLGTTKFVPQNGGQGVAHETVQGTPSHVSIHQVAVNLPGACQRLLNSVLRHFCEGDALDLFVLKHILYSNNVSGLLAALWGLALPNKCYVVPCKVMYRCQWHVSSLHGAVERSQQ